MMMIITEMITFKSSIFPFSLGGISPILLYRGLPIRIDSGITEGLYDCAET